MTAPANRDAQPPAEPQAPPLAAAAVNGQATGPSPGTRWQPPSETNGRQSVPFGNRPVSNAGQPPRAKGGSLLAAASCLLLLLAAAQGYVSFRAQYAFVDHAKHARIPSVLEALGLDTGAVIFAMLALSLARRGRRGTVERVLNVACALGSLAMNLLAANLTSPRSITVWVLPSALYALASDRLIAVSLGVQTGRTGRINDSSGSAIEQNRVGRTTGVAHGTLLDDSGRQSSSDDERDTTERGVADGLTGPAVQQCATGFGTQENAVVRRWVQASDPAAQVGPEGSAWRALGGLALWMLRLTFDARGTVTGFRHWVLAVAPVAPGTHAMTPRAVDGPQALPAGDDKRNGEPDRHAEPGPADPAARPDPEAQAGLSRRDALAHHELAPGEKKRAALIRLYERCGETGDPRYGDRAKAAALASEIASRIGYHPGTARRELARYLAAQPPAGPRHLPETEPAPAAEAVA